MSVNTEQVEQVKNEQYSKTHAKVSAKEKMKGNIDFAKVTICDSSSGEVISTKRVVLLANT